MRRRIPIPAALSARVIATAFVALAVLLPVLVLAQDGATKVPEPTLKRFAAPWVGYMVVIALAAVVVVVSLIPSKRGHQD